MTASRSASDRSASDRSASDRSASDRRPEPRLDPRLDPRLAARRERVARQEGRRRLWLIGSLTLVTTLALGAIGAAHSSLLDVESLSVVGAVHADAAQVVTASGLEPHQSLLGLHVGPAAEAVQAQVPWVERARIHRHLNGSVVIEVTERAGVLALPAGSRWAVVDATGRQLEVADAPPAGALALRGLEASGVPGEPAPPGAVEAATLVGQLSPQVAPLATGIVIDGGQLQVTLSSGGRANFGDPRDLGRKMVALETILNRVDLSCVAVIDVRVPAAPTVRREGRRTGTQEPVHGTGGC